jgi:copper homeostasis protein (lipoprotein)
MSSVMVRRAAALLVATLAGCVTVTTNSIGTFAGVLPCADCSGILTELRLYAEQPSGRAARYELTETYLGARDGGGSVGTTNRWATLRGSAADRDATVIQLDLGRIDALKNFLRVGDDELRLLDRNLREIFPKAPHSLFRVSDLPPVTLLESDSGQAIEVERGQRVFVVLGANRTTGYDWALDPFGPGPLASLGGPVYAQQAAPLGAGGTDIWFFGASRSGRQELVFQYRRPLERGTSAVKTLTYTVSVR